MWPFGKKNEATQLGDRVWVKKQKKYEHLISDAVQYLNEGKWVVVSFFFTDTGTLLSSLMKDERVSFCELDNVRPELEEKINIVQADSFLTQYFRDKMALGEKEVVILFAEHYPLFQTEEKLIHSLETFSEHVNFFFYNSFEDPLLTHFGASKIEEMLKDLGFQEDEMISSTLITGAIRSAQKKVGSQVKFEIRTFSVEDWFEKNFKP